MSRITKWKLEKTKVKVVFRLQFHATHIPQTGWEKLFISFIPTETGKSTAKTTKTNVRNGTCKWADPIYETTRLLQDTKSKQYDEKLYKFVVATGTSRSSILGEAIINLADYADAQKPSSVALPLQGCNCGTILHVTVQLLTSKTGFREFEQQRELREGGLPSGSNLNSHESGTGKISSPEEIANDHLDKVNSRSRFRPKSKELPLLEEVGLNEEYADSAVGFDGSSSTSESLYAEKHDTSSLKSTVSGDLNVLSQDQSPHTEKENPSNHRNSAPGNSDLVQGWSSDYSIDNDLAAVSNEENNRLRETLQVAESSIFELKLELSSLQCNAEELGLETRNFARQLAAEISSSEELGKEVLVLKEECSKFKAELARLENLKLSSRSTVMEPIRTDLVHLKGLLVVEDRVRELLNKADLSFDERDISFIRSDFEALLGVLQDIKQGKESTIKEIRDVSVLKNKEFDVGFYQESDFKCVNDAIDGRNFELLKQLDESKVENENLARKMDEMECYYESLIHELEENQKQMIVELQSIRNEHSTCVYTISTHKAEIESIHQQMNEQIIRFSKEREDFDSLTKELERRANTSESALKRARLNYSIAVDQLQKDLELLSFQVLSVYETNANLIKQAFSEENQDFVRNPRLQSQINGGDFHIEDLKKSLRLQEDLYKKVEEELCEMHSTNLYLDVFSKALHGTLVEADTDIRVMNEKMDEFSKQFEVCNASRDLLGGKLKKAMEEIQILDEYKVSYIAKAGDMLLQNRILEEKFESVSKEKYFLLKKIDEREATTKGCSVEKLEVENLLKLETLENENLRKEMSSLREELEGISKEKFLLSRKIAECEVMMKEYRSYGSKYEVCSAEKSEVENLLKVETVENESLRKEISSLREEFETFKAGLDDVAVSKENLQTIIDFLDKKLRSLLASYEEQCGGFSLLGEDQNRSLEFYDFKGIVMKLEEIQDNARKTILQLMEEKKALEDDKGTIELSLGNAKSEILDMKQKFKNDIHNMVTTIDTSNCRVEELQSKLDFVCRKFQSSSEFEEKLVQQNKEIFADLAVFEAELQKLSSKSRDLVQEILGLDTVYEELESSELTVTELKKETRDLTISLNGKNKEFAALESQLNSLKESLGYVQDELNVERSLRGKLEGKIEDFTSQLSKAELEKSRVLRVSLQKESSCITSLESELFKMHEFLIATDVELTCVRSLYETLAEILVEKLQSSDGNHRELQKKHLDSEEKLKFCVASEARYIEENAKLVKDLESLRFELESNVAQKRVILDSNNALTAQLEECKRRLELFEEEQLKHMGENDEQLTYSAEKSELENLLKLEKLENESLRNEMFSLREEFKSCKAGFDDVAASKENLQTIIDFLHEKLRSLLASYEEQCSGFFLLGEVQSRSLEFDDFKGIVMKLEEIQDNVRKTFLQLMEEKKELEDDKGTIELSLSNARSEILEMKQKFKQEIHNMVTQIDISYARIEKLQSKLDSVTSKFQSSSEVEGKHAQQTSEIFTDLAVFEAELQKLSSKNRDLAQEVLGLDTVYEELERSELIVTELKKETHDLTISLNGKNEESATLASQLNSLEESLSYVQDELNVERGLRGELERKIEDLTSQLIKVELEKSRVLRVLLEKDSSCIKGLESELFEMHYYLIAGDVELTCVRSHYETLAEILVKKLQLSDGNYREIQKKHLNAEDKLKFCIASEACYIEENAKLVKDLESLRFELESNVAQKRVFSDSNNALTSQLEECKRRLETLEEEQLKHMEENDEEDIRTLIFSKQELEIIAIVLKAKLDEQQARLITLEDHKDESLKLKKQFIELNHKLSEQILRTEEFKNLSIHLKDLKDEAEAEAKSLLAREKRQPEGPSVAMQESLRIAFIKEQYETKIQELMQQLSISKKHGEEMLWKLQDVVDEIENRKKSEALHLKRNEELSIKILELEGELQSVLIDKRERVNDYDRIKAELECALLSLECCKEEKEKLVGSLQELKVENSRIGVELDLRKGLMEKSKSGDRKSLMDGGGLRDANSIPNGEGGRSTELINARSIQGVLEPKSLHGIPEDSILHQEDLPGENSKHLAVDNNNFRTESLRSSMEHLHEELERMKNENSVLQTNIVPKLQDLEGEFTQLQKANEELGSMFPLFNEIGGSGNALERVLALEIELAESLREKKKKKSTLQFQSSFLKQHSHEEAIFRSFRDINELIKEMLELKGRYANVETDLKEMHDRYSQLSLQFAEVEGERQKLMMTLKNIRTPKKLVGQS